MVNKQTYWIIGIIAVISILFLQPQGLFSTVSPSDNNIFYQGDPFAETDSTKQQQAAQFLAEYYNYPQIQREQDSNLLLQTVIGGATCETYPNSVPISSFSERDKCYQNTADLGLAVQLWKLYDDGSWIPNNGGFVGEIAVPKGQTKCFSSTLGNPGDAYKVNGYGSLITYIGKRYRVDYYSCSDVVCQCTGETSVGCGTQYGCLEGKMKRSRSCSPDNQCTDTSKYWESLCVDWVDTSKPGCSVPITPSCVSDCNFNGQTACSDPTHEKVCKTIGGCNKWQTPTECANGCQSGKCVTSTIPEPYYTTQDLSKVVGIKEVPPNTEVGVFFDISSKTGSEIKGQKVEVLYYPRESIEAQNFLKSAGDIKHLMAVATQTGITPAANCVGDNTQAFTIDIPVTSADKYKRFYANPKTPKEGEYILLAGTYDKCAKDGGTGYISFAVMDHVIVTASAKPQTENCINQLDDDFDGTIDGLEEDCTKEIKELKCCSLICGTPDNYIKIFTPESKLGYYTTYSQCDATGGWIGCEDSEVSMDKCEGGKEECAMGDDFCAKESKCISEDIWTEERCSAVGLGKALSWEDLEKLTETVARESMCDRPNECENSNCLDLSYIDTKVSGTKSKVTDWYWFDKDGLCVEKEKEFDLFAWIETTFKVTRNVAYIILGIGIVLILYILNMAVSGQKPR